MRKLFLNKVTFILFIDFILYLLLPLEFGKFPSRNIIYPLIWLSITIPLIINQFQTQKASISKKISIAIGLLAYLFFSCLIAFTIWGFCSWLNYGVIYKNKSNESLKLICKSYECYGTAGNCNLYKRRELISNIYWVTKFTESNVDSVIWEKIPYGKSGE